MIPPTPTFLPPGTAYFEVGHAYTLWGSTSSAVQSWNMLGDGRYVLQAVFLIAVVIAGFYILMRFAKDYTKRDAEE